VPTFNERQNVRELIARLELALRGISWELIFVDDDSPGQADRRQGQAGSAAFAASAVAGCRRPASKACWRPRRGTRFRPGF
jgi:hypothetical protein